MSTRQRVAAAGFAIVVAYVIATAIAGRLVPIARRPILDGLAPQEPYRWVKPPTAFAVSNQPPATGTFSVLLGPGGARPNTLTTGDLQVTLIVPKGLFPPAPGQDSVIVKIEPLDPGSVGAAPDGLSITGNVYRIQAAYQPSGDPVDFAVPAGMVLVYPQVATPTGVSHLRRTLIASSDGKSWSTVKSTDVPAQLQALGSIRTLGYVAVAASGVASPSGSSPSAGSGNTLIPIVWGVSAVLIVAAVLARVRRSGYRRHH